MPSLAECAVQKKMVARKTIDYTIMFATSKYPKFLIFNQIQLSWYFAYGSHLGKKWRFKFFSIFPSCWPHKVPRYQCTLQSDKVDIFAIWQPFWKKMADLKKISIVPSYSRQQKLHVLDGIISLAIIVSEIYIKCQSWKIGKNNIKRAITPTSFHGSSRKLNSR